MATFFNTCPPQQLPTTDLYVLKDGTVARELPKGYKAADAIHIKAGAAVRVNDALADALHKANLEVDDTDTRSWEFEYNLADPDHTDRHTDLGMAILDKKQAAVEDAKKGRTGLIANDDGVIGTVGPEPGEVKNPEHKPDPAKVREDPADPASKPAS